MFVFSMTVSYNKDCFFVKLHFYNNPRRLSALQSNFTHPFSNVIVMENS